MILDRAAVNGIGIAYRTAGEPDAPPVVLVHGYTGNHTNWAFTARALVREGYRTLSPENPGHGESEAPDDPGCYSIASMAATLHGLAEQLQFAPAVWAGHSMGGAVVEELALSHPGSVRALVLVDSAGGGPRGAPGWEQQRAFMQRGMEYARENGLPALWDWQIENGMRPQLDSLPDDAKALARSEFLKTSLPGFLHCGAALHSRRSTLEGLASLAVPALVIRGENENEGLRLVADDLAATIPGARYEVIPGAAHSPQFEAPEAFNEVLLDFMRSI
jgi:3-oxoadipate enol-lactonase